MSEQSFLECFIYNNVYIEMRTHPLSVANRNICTWGCLGGWGNETPGWGGSRRFSGFPFGTVTAGAPGSAQALTFQKASRGVLGSVLCSGSSPCPKSHSPLYEVLFLLLVQVVAPLESGVVCEWVGLLAVEAACTGAVLFRARSRPRVWTLHLQCSETRRSLDVTAAPQSPGELSLVVGPVH